MFFFPDKQRPAKVTELKAFWLLDMHKYHVARFKHEAL